MACVNEDYFTDDDLEVVNDQQMSIVIVVDFVVVDTVAHRVLDSRNHVSTEVMEHKIPMVEKEVYFHLKENRDIVYKIIKVIREN